MRLRAAILFLLLLTTSATASGPEVFSLRKQYEGEEKRGVLYLEDSQIVRYKVDVDGEGRLIQLSEGKIFSSYLTEEPTLFVLTEDGSLYFSAFSRHNVFHHSSLTRGKPVISAGQALVYEGRILALDNVSGHYYPSIHSLGYVIRKLEELGYRDASKIVVSSTAFADVFSKFEKLFCTSLFRAPVN